MAETHYTSTVTEGEAKAAARHATTMSSQPVSTLGLDVTNQSSNALFRRPARVALTVLCLVVSAVIGSVVTLHAFCHQDRGDESTAGVIDKPQDPFHPGGSTTQKVTIASPATTKQNGSTTPTDGPPTKVFTQGKLYYRAAYLDDGGGYLFVGALEKLFRLNLDDISGQHFRVLHLPAADNEVENCKRRGRHLVGPDVDCRNHIHEVHPIRNGNTLYICGTNSLAPTDWQVKAENLVLLPVDEQVKIGQNVRGRPPACPFYMQQNTSAIWVDDAPVNGTSFVVALHAREMEGDNYYITRTDAYDQKSGARLHGYLTTRDGGISMLSRPHSAGTLTLGEHMYFAFREDALEREACGIRVSSSLARICKNDLGNPVNTKLWSSFMKLRLQCVDTTVREKFYPEFFSFDGIYDTSWVPDMDGGLLFGAFVTVTHGYPDSAVCAFRLADVKRVFATSDFFEPYQAKPYRISGRETSVPSPRPGIACPTNSLGQSFEGPQFLAKHPLLFDRAPQRHNRTFFARPGSAFSSLATFVLNTTWGTWLICYVATVDGKVMKLAEEHPAGSQVPNPAVLLDTFTVTAEPIRKLLVSLKRHSLYVLSDDAVRQYRLDACEGRHSECASCVRDPFCGWDGTRCLPHTGGPTATTARAC